MHNSSGHGNDMHNNSQEAKIHRLMEFNTLTDLTESPRSATKIIAVFRRNIPGLAAEFQVS